MKKKSSCLIYSLGSGRDFRFEEAVHQHLPHCSIHTIDMQYAFCPTNVCTFHHVQLGDGRNGTKTLRQLMIDINHTNAEIDILKIDIEYSEYVFFHLLFSNNRQFQPIFIRQILIVRMQSIFFSSSFRMGFISFLLLGNPSRSRENLRNQCLILFI